jgi:hypothetical protein
MMTMISRANQSRTNHFSKRISFLHLRVFLALAASTCIAQDAKQAARAQPETEQQLPVNWIYGAYIPEDAPLVPLDAAGRWRLYLRQGFTTPGIYAKTVLFTISDQANNAPPGWSQDAEGFAKRVGTRYAQFLIQNSFSALGNGIAGWEPRYDLCRNCKGVGQRIRHAVVRNFLTYASDEGSLRPQLFLYAGSFGGAALAATWEPYRPSPLVKGYQGVATQAWVGVACNLLAEFSPDFKRAIHRKK